MDRLKLNLIAIVSFSALAEMAVNGCGDMKGDSTIESTKSALTFSPWTAIPNGTFRPGSPTLFNRVNALDVYALGNDVPSGQIYFNNYFDDWNGWDQGISMPSGVTFIGPPAVAPAPPGPGGTYALAAADAGGHFYVQISFVETTPSFPPPLQSWAMVPFASQFVGQPAIASTTTNGNTTLFLAGRGLDNKIYVAQNVVTGSTSSHPTYSPAGWTSFAAIPNGTLQSAPAITWACPQTSSDPLMTVVAVGFDNRLWVNHFNGSAWSAGWTPIQNGTFQTKTPAVVTACPTPLSNRETFVFALGMDSRIYLDRDHGTETFDVGYTAIGDQIFTDGPGATYALTSIAVAARVASGYLFWTRSTLP